MSIHAAKHFLRQPDAMKPVLLSVHVTFGIKHIRFIIIPLKLCLSRAEQQSEGWVPHHKPIQV